MFRVLYHFVDFRVRQTARRLDADLLLLTGCLVFCGDMKNAVRIDIEGYFDLWHSAGCGWHTGQLEPADRAVADCHLPFTLKDVDLHRSLVVFRGGKHLRLFGGDSGVA